jgi:predicted alpha-1,2-mannosidase
VGTGRRLLALALAAALAAGPAQAAPAGDDPTRFVDPMIGTLGSGFVFPGPAAPFGMVQLSPDTDGYFAYTGYLWSDAAIRGFSHVHVESMGVPAGGEVPFMPTAGRDTSTDVERYKAPFTHALERAEVGSYRVTLLAPRIDVELAAGIRVGMHRYRFPPGAWGNVLIDAGRQIAGGADRPPLRLPGANRAVVRILPDRRTVVGTANADRAAPRGYAVHFAARFDRPADALGVFEARGAPVRWGRASVDGLGAGAVLAFAPGADRDVVVKVGISFTSVEAALVNLEAELPGDDFDLDALAARTRAAWRRALQAVRVRGGAPATRRSFFTALYHAQHHPNVWSDADGSYLGHDGAVHRVGAPGDPMPAGSTVYANFSLWDTYRGEHQLLALLAPGRVRDMMRSLRAMVVQGGRLPRWSLMNAYADFMVGEPALPVIADAFCRGLVPPDALGDLYREARRLALVDRRDPTYLALGYVPHDVDAGGASSTLEHALADFALALVAHRLGETADRDRLLAQSGNWRNVFDPTTRFVRPRLADGSWLAPYRPELPTGFVEGTGWQYTWLVPHDVAGLFDAMGTGRGGEALVRRRLDVFFLAPLSAALPVGVAEAQQKLTLYGIVYVGNQYAPSNEHDLQAPFLYDVTSEPWKTQAVVRALQSLYRPTPDGLPGNDDLGTLSAWFVWSAIGLFPAIPGAPVYLVGSPLFERTEIRLPGGRRLVVEAPGASLLGRYVQRGSLGGRPLDRAWLTQREWEAAGTLRLEMGPAPNRRWAARPEARPPSASTHPLGAFGCGP